MTVEEAPEDVVATLRAAGCVYAEEEADLLAAEATGPAALADMVRRRAEGEPLEHVLGWARFAGRRLVVAPGVFVPRRRTELLAREAMRLCRAGGVLVELCCGCAPVATVVGTDIPGLTVLAADVDPAAVACAARNLPSGAVACCGDLFDALPATVRHRVDVLVANAPYVPHAAIELMPREARLHEPTPALDGGADGLDVHRRLVAVAGDWLAPGGHLLVEIAEEQVATALTLLDAHGFENRVVRDVERSATVVAGRRPPEFL